MNFIYIFFSRRFVHSHYTTYDFLFVRRVIRDSFRIANLFNFICRFFLFRSFLISSMNKTNPRPNINMKSNERVQCASQSLCVAPMVLAVGNIATKRRKNKNQKSATILLDNVLPIDRQTAPWSLIRVNLLKEVHR